MRDEIANKIIKNIRIINSFKTGLACFVSFLLSRHFDLFRDGGTWACITIVVVMSSNIRVGGALKKGYMRILGTLTAGLYSMGIIYLFHSNPYLLSGFGFLGIICFSYIATKSGEVSYVGVLGGATISMALLSLDVSYLVAIDRISEILFGVIVSVIVSALVFPVFSVKPLYEKISENLILLKQYFENEMYLNNKNILDDFKKLTDGFLANLTDQKKILAEYTSEFGRSHSLRMFEEVIYLQKKLLFRMEQIYDIYALSQKSHQKSETSNKNKIEKNFFPQKEFLEFINLLIQDVKASSFPNMTKEDLLSRVSIFKQSEEDTKDFFGNELILEKVKEGLVQELLKIYDLIVQLKQSKRQNKFFNKNNRISAGNKESL